MSSKNGLIFLGLGICISSVLIAILYSSLPRMTQEEKYYIKIPKSMHDLKSLGLVLSNYKEKYHWQVMSSIILIYITLQSFMIPGSVLFSILLGYLFNFSEALFVISLCSAIGASVCFVLFRYIGENFIQKLFPKKMELFKKQTTDYKRFMFIYIFALRLAPFIPNWSVNISAPFFNVPLIHFFLGTFFGVVPLSLVFVKTGNTLHEMASLDSIPTNSLSVMLLLSVLSLLPFIFRNQMRKMKLYRVSLCYPGREGHLDKAIKSV